MQLPTLHSAHTVRRIWMSVAIILSLALLAFTTLLLGVYGAGWEDRLTQNAMRVVPLPAISVNWQAGSITDWLEQRQALQHYQTTQQRRAPGAVPTQSETEISRTTLRKMVRDTALNQALDDLSIRVTSTDVDQAFSSQLAQTSNRAATERAIFEMYGWTPAEYRQYVIRPAVAREKLREFLSFTAPYNRASQTQAENVLKLVQAGDESFADLAKRYSDDVYGATGGDLGFIRRGQVADEIETVVFTLRAEQVSDIVHTKFGFHILKVLEQRETDGQTEVHVLQIFISAPSVDTFLTERLRSARVAVWLPNFHWDQKAVDVAKD